jgi:hypothetical protein
VGGRYGEGGEQLPLDPAAVREVEEQEAATKLLQVGNLFLAHSLAFFSLSPDRSCSRLQRVVLARSTLTHMQHAMPSIELSTSLTAPQLHVFHAQP